MALGLVARKCVAGVLVIPNMNLARYLTDRIGNIEEIRPYIPLWENLSVKEGVLELVVIEQDGESTHSPRIPKGRDGRAQEAMLAALVERS
ncbi:Type-2 restriction enzyme BamHI [compost metagenome]